MLPDIALKGEHAYASDGFTPWRTIEPPPPDGFVGVSITAHSVPRASNPTVRSKRRAGPRASGVAAGAEVGGSPDGATAEANSAASQMGSGVLISPEVTVTESGGLVTVTVTGQSEQLVPGIPVSVRASASAPLEGLSA